MGCGAVINGIGPFAAINDVITGPADKGIIPVQTRQRVVLIIPDQGIIMQRAGNILDPVKNVVAVTAGNRAVFKIGDNAGTFSRIINRVAAFATDQHVRTRTANQRIVTGPAIKGIVAGTTDQAVIANAAFDGVIAAQRIDNVIAVPADHFISIVGAQTDIDTNEVVCTKLGCRHAFERDGIAAFKIDGQIAVGIGAKHFLKRVITGNVETGQIDLVGTDIEVRDGVIAVTRIEDDLIGTATKAQRVITGAGIKGVIACTTDKGVALTAADKGIVEFRTADHFDPVKGICTA